MHWYPRYVPVDEQRARAVSEIQELRARGVVVQPIELRGRTLAQNFWGRHWCEHLESFSEYAARLAHGRAYVRNGSVCHLAIEAGGVDAMVVGSALHRVSIRIRRLQQPAWAAIRRACAGRVPSLPDLHQGRLPDRVIEVVTDRDTGLFPQPGEIVHACDCPDRTPMCKHAAAALSGVGSRLDNDPELLFLLRGVDETELIADETAPPPDATADPGTGTTLDADFGTGNGVGVRLSAAETPTTVGPAGSGPPVFDMPLPVEPAPRKAKKTLTYRPPSPIASLPLNMPSHTGSPATGFRPTGEMVARLRDECGCSVAEFADLIQVTSTTVRRWETTSGPLSLHARPWEALRALHREIEKHSG